MWLRAPGVHPEGVWEALGVTDVFGDIQEMMQACPLLGLGPDSQTGSGRAGVGGRTAWIPAVD